jgi:hypothetical protein
MTLRHTRDKVGNAIRDATRARAVSCAAQSNQSTSATVPKKRRAKRVRSERQQQRDSRSAQSIGVEVKPTYASDPDSPASRTPSSEELNETAKLNPSRTKNDTINDQILISSDYDKCKSENAAIRRANEVQKKLPYPSKDVCSSRLHDNKIMNHYEAHQSRLEQATSSSRPVDYSHISFGTIPLQQNSPVRNMSIVSSSSKRRVECDDRLDAVSEMDGDRFLTAINETLGQLQPEDIANELKPKASKNFQLSDLSE